MNIGRPVVHDYKCEAKISQYDTKNYEWKRNGNIIFFWMVGIPMYDMR